MIDVVSDGEKGPKNNSKDFLLDNRACDDIIHIATRNLGWGMYFIGEKDFSLGHIDLGVSSVALANV